MTIRFSSIALMLALFSLAKCAGLITDQVALAQLEFRKIQLTDRYYCDGVDSGDINGDGHLDVVAGPFWYQGPSFASAHEFYPALPLAPEQSPSNSMFSFVHDFNSDGHLDILVLGRIHKHAAYWYENPHDSDSKWKKHFVFERVRGESPALIDLDGDGIPQLICHWDGAWGWIAPDSKDPQLPWTFTAVGERQEWPQFYHGEGVGDINGDGRLDLIINDGWYEQPSSSSAKHWPFHRQRFSSGRGGAQMFTCDVDSDGDSDVITSLDGHGWGLAWFEQTRAATGNSFAEHRIMGDRSEEKQYGVAFSQPHALAMADLDADGFQDIVTGKRRWAHGPDGDIEPNAPPVVYWFHAQQKRDGSIQYIPQMIDGNSGVGVQIQTVDINSDGRIDVLTASKLGTFVFLNLGAE